MAHDSPKNRLGLISPGVGKISAALMCLVIGLIALSKDPPFGQSLLMMALIFGAWGAFTIYRGFNAPLKSVACPHCKQKNALLTDVREFSCVSCGKPVKLVRKPPAG